MSDHGETPTGGTATDGRGATVPGVDVTSPMPGRAERDDAAGSAVPVVDDADLLLALEPAHRFRCDGCGNVTRFDVTLNETTRRFHHFDLGGDHRVEEEEVLERSVRSVVCRWCGRDDAIRVEPAPVANA